MAQRTPAASQGLCPAPSGPWSALCSIACLYQSPQIQDIIVLHVEFHVKALV